MEYLRPPQPFNIHEPEGWSKWKQLFEIFLVASEKTKVEENVKIALLLNISGESCVEIYNTFEKSKVRTLRGVLKRFDKYFLPEKNICEETFKFNNIEQKEDQTLDSFMEELENQASHCEFVCDNDDCKRSFSDRMIRDRFILGVEDKEVQKELLESTDTSLEKIKTYCSMRELQTSVRGLMDYFIENEKEKNKAQSRKCTRCGAEHPPGKCPALNQTCYNCLKEGHFSRMCFQKQK